MDEPNPKLFRSPGVVGGGASGGGGHSPGGGSSGGVGGGEWARLGEVGTRVCRALEVLLDQSGGARARPVEVASSFGLNKSVASRMMKALRTADPVAALAELPGSEALRGFVAASGAGRGAVAVEASRAIDEFEAFVRDELGGRDRLAAVLSAVLPDERRRFLLSNKQAVYRGLSNLIGVSAECDVLALLLTPSRLGDGSRLDAVWVQLLTGVVQRRPGCVVSRVHRMFSREDGEGAPLVTLDGSGVASPFDMLIDEWTTVGRDRLHMESHGDHSVVDIDVGPISGDAGFSIAMAHVSVGAYPSVIGPARSSGGGMNIDVPTKLGVIDMLCDGGVWEGYTPEVMTHRQGARGAVDPNDRLRRVDLIELDDQAERVDWGTLRLGEVSDYPGLIASVCERVGVDARRLHGFRVRAQYPVVGTQVSMDFKGPGGAGGA